MDTWANQIIRKFKKRKIFVWIPHYFSYQKLCFSAIASDYENNWMFYYYLQYYATESSHKLPQYSLMTRIPVITYPMIMTPEEAQSRNL
jgi:4-alpha-glucanotransferase